MNYSPPPLSPLHTLTNLDRTLRRAALYLGLAAVALFALVGGIFLGRGNALKLPEDRLIVTVLNIGHGEASWVRTPGGKFIVIGGGPPGRGRALVASLDAAGAQQIDLLLLPYPYAEAIGGVQNLLGSFVVEEAIEPGGSLVNQWQTQMRLDLQKKQVSVRLGRAGDTINIDGVKVTILAPADPLLNVTPASANNSLVVRLDWGETSFLWAGGIEQAGERELIARTPELRADWLRAAHFGTRTASSPEFLRLVMPEFIVLSVGVNPDGLPHRETLDRMEATGAKIYRTDNQPGSLTFTSDGTVVYGPS